MTGANAIPDFVVTFARGLSVIRALATRQEPMSLAEVARASHLSRPAARRFLITLVELGYATSANGRWTLTPRVMELGYSYLSGLPLTDIVRPHLQGLAAELEQSTAVAVLDDHDIVYVARVPSRRMMRVHIDVGTRLPAHNTSMGRVLLAALSPDHLDAYLRTADLTPPTPRSPQSQAELRAELKHVRSAGYSLVEEELDEDLRGVSMPLHRHGTAIAAINASVHVRGDSAVALREFILPGLRATVDAIEPELDMISGGPPTSAVFGPSDAF